MGVVLSAIYTRQDNYSVTNATKWVCGQKYLEDFLGGSIMTSPIFKVSVPFEPYLSEGTGGTSRTWIGEDVKRINDIEIIHAGPLHVGCIEITAGDHTEAIEISVQKIEQLLRLLAAGNHAFIVHPSQVKCEFVRKIDKGNEDTRNSSSQMKDTVVIGSQVGVTVTINKVDQIEQSLRLVDKWPISLQRALNLNYASSLSQERDIRFLLLSAALEVLMSGALGYPSSLLKVKLEENYGMFKQQLRSFIKGWGMTELDSDRVANHTLETHSVSIVDRIQEYLPRYGIDVPRKDIQEWRRIRGSLAHGDYVLEEELKLHLGNLQKALREAINCELERLN